MAAATRAAGQSVDAGKQDRGFSHIGHFRTNALKQRIERSQTLFHGGDLGSRTDDLRHFSDQRRVCLDGRGMSLIESVDDPRKDRRSAVTEARGDGPASPFVFASRWRQRVPAPQLPPCCRSRRRAPVRSRSARDPRALTPPFGITCANGRMGRQPTFAELHAGSSYAGVRIRHRFQHNVGR